MPQVQLSSIVDDTALPISITTVRLPNGIKLQLANDLDEPMLFEMLRVRGGDLHAQLPFEGWTDDEPRSVRLTNELVISLVRQYASQPGSTEHGAPVRAREPRDRA